MTGFPVNSKKKSSSRSYMKKASPSVTRHRRPKTYGPKQDGCVRIRYQHRQCVECGSDAHSADDQRGGVYVVDAMLLIVRGIGGHPKSLKWGIHLTQVAPRRCGLVDPQTPARCTQNAPWGARRRPERRLGHEATFRAYQRSRTRHGHRRLENMVLSASLSGGRQWPTTVSCSHLSQVDTPLSLILRFPETPAARLRIRLDSLTPAREKKKSWEGLN